MISYPELRKNTLITQRQKTKHNFYADIMLKQCLHKSSQYFKRLFKSIRHQGNANLKDHEL